MQPGYGEHIRTAVRQWAILAIRREDKADGDEDNWQIEPWLPLFTWLADVCEKLDFKWTPAQVLETEDRYPGLINSIATLLWQKRLIRAQMEGTGEATSEDDG